MGVEHFTLDTSEHREYSRKLHLMSSVALPNAVRYTLDRMAYQTMRKARSGLRDHFTIRNTWTSRSIAYDKVGTSNNIDRMESATGSRLAYMREQEEGIDRPASGKHGEPIQTTEASGEGQAGVRRKRVLKRFYLSRLKVAKNLHSQAKSIQRHKGFKGRGRSQSQTLAIMINLARKQRLRFVFWRAPSGKRGLFRIDGDRLPMIYDLTETRIRSDERHWLTEPSADVAETVYEIYGKALRFQLYRLR